MFKREKGRHCKFQGMQKVNKMSTEGEEQFSHCPSLGLVRKLLSIRNFRRHAWMEQVNTTDQVHQDVPAVLCCHPWPDNTQVSPWRLGSIWLPCEGHGWTRRGFLSSSCFILGLRHWEPGNLVKTAMSDAFPMSLDIHVVFSAVPPTQLFCLY